MASSHLDIWEEGISVETVIDIIEPIIHFLKENVGKWYHYGTFAMSTSVYHKSQVLADGGDKAARAVI